MKTQMKTAAVAAVMAAAWAGGASASELFGTAYSAATPLYRVNQATGALSTVGPAGATDVGDLTSDVSTGAVWGVRINDNQLISYDTTTGANTLFRTITGASRITSIAFNPVTRRLYGNTSQSLSNVPGDELYEIDVATGAATLIGEIGANNFFALAFGNDGTLYGVSQSRAALFSISTTTGAGTFIGATGRSGIFDIAARPEDGVMFAADTGGGDNSLYTINLSTGATTLVGAYGSNVNIAGLAFIPSPGAAGLLAIAGLAGAARRRR